MMVKFTVVRFTNKSAENFGVFCREVTNSLNLKKHRHGTYDKQLVACDVRHVPSSLNMKKHRCVTCDCLNLKHHRAPKQLEPESPTLQNQNTIAREQLKPESTKHKNQNTKIRKHENSSNLTKTKTMKNHRAPQHHDLCQTPAHMFRLVAMNLSRL